MGEKQGKDDGGEKKKKAEGGAGEKGKKESGGGGDGVITAVLEVDMHCEGCAKKVKRSASGYEGVETVTVDSGNHKLTVVGKLDPWKLRERVEVKTHKKVVLVSPTDLPKKEEKKDEKPEKKVDVKAKAPVVSTVVLKIRLHCEGCIQRIRRSIFKVEGVEEVKIDSLKDLVTVKGSMDVDSMVPFLANKFKRAIDIIPGKKDDGRDKKGKEEKKEEKKEKKDKEVSAEKDSGGGGEKNGGGKKEGKGGDDGAGKVEMNKMEYNGGVAGPVGHYMHYYNYPVQTVPAPDQYFSDENPNACSVM